MGRWVADGVGEGRVGLGVKVELAVKVGSHVALSVASAVTTGSADAVGRAKSGVDSVADSATGIPVAPSADASVANSVALSVAICAPLVPGAIVARLSSLGGSAVAALHALKSVKAIAINSHLQVALVTM